MRRLLAVVCLWTLLLATQHVSAISATEDEVTRLILVAGDEALSKGRKYYQEALAKYTEALVRTPQSERGLYSRAELLSLLHETPRALEDLHKLLNRAPDHARGLKLRMSLLAHDGNIADAIKDGQRLVHVYGAQKKTTLQKEVQEKLGRLQKYYTGWKRIASVLEGPLEGHEPVGSDPKLQEKYQECVRLLEHYIQDFAKDSVDLHLRRASCAVCVNNNAVAVSEIKYVMQMDQQNLLAIALNAKALRSFGALDQAKRELRRCLTIDPEYAPCARLHKLVRGQQKYTAAIEKAMERKDYAKAVQHIEAAFEVERDPVYGDQLLLWECAARVGMRDTTKGMKACTAVLERVGPGTKDYVDVQLHIAELHILDDNLDQAEAAANKALEISPRSAKVDEMLQKLAKLRKMASRKDYYKILGVKKTATAQDIKRSYRKLAMQYHPDQLRSKEMPEADRTRMEKAFRDINEAKEVLLDEEKRLHYDNGEDVMNPQAQQQQQHHGETVYGFPGGFGGFSGFQFNGFQGGGGGQQFRFFRG